MNVRVRTLVASIALVSLAGCQGGLRSGLFGRGAACGPAAAAPAYDMPQGVAPGYEAGCGCGTEYGVGMTPSYGYGGIPESAPGNFSGGWMPSSPETIVPNSMHYSDGYPANGLPTPADAD